MLQPGREQGCPCSQGRAAARLPLLLARDHRAQRHPEPRLHASGPGAAWFKLPAGACGYPGTLHGSEGTSAREIPTAIPHPNVRAWKRAACERNASVPIEVCSLFVSAVWAVVNMCPVSSAKRATQKVEFRAIKEEKQEEVVVEVPEPKPTDQIREKPGIAVVVATTLCGAFPVLHMLVPDNSEFHQIWQLSFFVSLQEEFCTQRAGRDSPAEPRLWETCHSSALHLVRLILARRWGEVSDVLALENFLLIKSGCFCKCGLENLKV